MKKKIWMIVGAVILLAGLVVGGIGLSKYLEERNAGETYEELKEDFDIEPLVDIPTIEETVENPIDFKTLTAKYLTFPLPTDLLQQQKTDILFSVRICEKKTEKVFYSNTS